MALHSPIHTNGLFLRSLKTTENRRLEREQWHEISTYMSPKHSSAQICNPKFLHPRQ